MVHWTIITSAFGIIVATCGGILGFVIFPIMLQNKVKENTIIKEGTETFERFVQIPQPLTFKVYVFNVTNPERVQQGGIPIVKEMGPYVYKQYRRKDIKEFSRDETSVSFSQQQMFEFDKSASTPNSENDKIVVLNMHMNAFLQIFEREVRGIFSSFANRVNKTLNRTPGVRLIKRIMDRIRGKRKTPENEPGLALLMAHVNANLKNVFNNPKSMFLSTTIKDYLFDGIKFCINPFGIARAICEQIKQQAGKTIRQLDDGSLAFSFFSHKNRTDNGIIEVHTGKGSAEDFLKILKYNEESKLHVWLNSTNHDSTSTCNMLNGTDASSYPPFRQRGDNMYIFSADICRSVQLFYDHDIKYMGIPGFRYTTGNNFLYDIDECFCVDTVADVLKKKNGCLYSGAMDLSQCVDAPVILTNPHFLGIAKEYKARIKGLKPNLRKHETFVDVQSLTGVPLQGGKRVQFNMFIKRINKIKLTENLTTSLVPSIWVEEGIALNQKMVNNFKSKIINILDILDIMQWTLMLSGTLLFFISIILYFILKRKIKINPKK